MTHEWKFFRAGGVEQVVIRTGADIAHLGELDQKLWVALACPTRGLEFDHHTLDLIDTDHDGRIRAPDVIAAAHWACARLKDPDQLVQAGDSLAIDAIDDREPVGAELAAEAQRVLGLIGKPDAAVIALGDIADRRKLLAAMRFSGDGLLPAAAGADAALTATLQLIADTPGIRPDAAGGAGIVRKQAEAFFALVEQQRRWRQRAVDDPRLAPLGDGTAQALEAMAAVQAKVDDYFARCRVGAYDSRAVAAMNPSREDYEQLSAQTLSLATPAIADLPLAAAGPRRRLSLRDGVNPAWAEAVDAFRRRVVVPLFADRAEHLEEADWRMLQDLLAPARAWLAERPANGLSALPNARIDTLADAATREAVFELLSQDEAAKAQRALIDQLEKLLYLKRDLLALLHNFVSFAAFYQRRGAIFQAGTLYLDGRSCDLSVEVADVAKHAPLAVMAKAYLAYCECTREGKKKHVVSAFTAGDVDFLFVGRNGIFYDREGRDWDATIVKVIENPTSIGQAFLSPYKKFIRMIEEQVAKRAAAGEAAAQTDLGAITGKLVQGDAAAGAPAAAGAKRTTRVDVGTVAALGVALGSISAVMVAVFAKFIDLGWWIPVAICGIVMAISGPSMLIAWLKLRQRSLGPILDASGWAINGRMRVNVRLGASLSQTARVPIGAARLQRDPFAERHGKAYAASAAVVAMGITLVAWRFALLNPLLPEPLQVMPANATPATATVLVPVATGGASAPVLAVQPATGIASMPQ